MAVISELPDDGSNGGDPNKNPIELQKNPQEDDENPQEDDENPQEDDENLQEAENLPQDQVEDDEDQNENPQEDDENQNENPQEAEHLPIRQEIPQDLIQTIVAHVRRCHYPKLSLVSKAFHRLINSRELYQTRSRHGLTEQVLYALIGFRPPLFDHLDWYILYRNLPRNIVKLRKLSSMPRMNPGCAVVTIGHHMYVIGGCLSLNHPTEKVYLIDCRFHTCEPLPDMHVARCHAAAGVIDGKIYVIGGCKKRCADWVEVFDVQTQTWSTIPDSPSSIPPAASARGEFVSSVVVQEMIFILDLDCCCLYYEPTQPTELRWGTIGNLMNHFWRGSACVIDDKFYTIDVSCALGHIIVVYDPNDMIIRPVKGEYSLPDFVYQDSQLVSLDGNSLMIVGPVRSDDSSEDMYDVWCVDIALEPREGNWIWGTVYSKALVLSSEKKTPYIEHCRFATV